MRTIYHFNMNYRERYISAHKLFYQRNYPTAWRNGFWTPPKTVNVDKANGLTMWIVNFLNWNGHRATRISSAGRAIKSTDPGIIGMKFIPSTTRKGTADISATIKGKSVMLEVKIGRDKPSPEQIREQAKERSAGGIYEFISTPGQFLELYDGLLLL